MRLLRDQRLRPFALDIETDSTIQPDEDAQKQRNMEMLAPSAACCRGWARWCSSSPAAAEFAGDLLAGEPEALPDRPRPVLEPRQDDRGGAEGGVRREAALARRR